MGLQIKTKILIGGNQSQESLQDVSIIIGTVGRVFQVLCEDNISDNWGKDLEFLIIDEADRILQTD